VAIHFHLLIILALSSSVKEIGGRGKTRPRSEIGSARNCGFPGRKTDRFPLVSLTRALTCGGREVDAFGGVGQVGPAKSGKAPSVAVSENRGRLPDSVRFTRWGSRTDGGCGWGLDLSVGFHTLGLAGYESYVLVFWRVVMKKKGAFC
jgi:hypothetical protein